MSEEVTEAVARAMKQSFKERVAASAGEAFEDTGVTLPGDAVWSAYAQAAVAELRRLNLLSEEGRK